MMMDWCCCCRKKRNNKVDDDTDASKPLIKTADGYDGDSDDSMDDEQLKVPPLEKQRTIGGIIVNVSESSFSDMDGLPKLVHLGKTDSVGSVDISDLLEEQERSLSTEGVISELEKPKVSKTISWSANNKLSEKDAAN
jgi:hypothetical protein